MIDKAKSTEEISKYTYKNTIDTKDIVESLQSDYNIEIEDIETIKNEMKQIVKNDNINSKQITELEQSEGISIDIYEMTLLFFIISYKIFISIIKKNVILSLKTSTIIWNYID